MGSLGGTALLKTHQQKQENWRRVRMFEIVDIRSSRHLVSSSSLHERLTQQSGKIDRWSAIRPAASLSDALSSRKLTSPVHLDSDLDILNEKYSKHHQVSINIDNRSSQHVPDTATSMQTLVWQPQRQSASAVVDPRQLTVKIKGCRGWEELRDVCVRHNGAFNSTHLAAAITHLAQISSYVSSLDRASSGVYAGPSDYGEAFMLPGSRRRNKTGASIVSAQMNHSGSSSLLDKLLREVLRHPERFTARQISNMVWAAARLQGKETLHPDSTVALFLKSAVQVSASLKGQFLPQHLSNFAYGIALLQFDPGRQWLQSLIQDSIVMIDSFKPCELVILAFSMNKLLPHYVSDSVLSSKMKLLHHSLTSASFGQLMQYTGKELSSLALSLTSLRRICKCEAQHDQSRWTLTLLRSAQDRLNAGDLNSQSITSLLLACSRLLPLQPDYEEKAHRDQRTSLFNNITFSTEQSLSHWSLQALSHTYISIAKLGHSPTDTWMQSFETAVEDHLARALNKSRTTMPTGFARNLGIVIYGMSILQWKPSLSFISAFLACCSIVDFRPDETNRIILSLKRLGIVCNQIPDLHWNQSKRYSNVV
jgi:hypothetical protein